MEGGTYTIVLDLDDGTTIEFGAAGSRVLEPGLYAYTGSAFGPGGLSRIDRHRRVFRGENDTRHWHVDYLLGTTEIDWIGHWSTPANAECVIATTLPGEPIEGIGATDCDCVSHLIHGDSGGPLLGAIEKYYSNQSTVIHSEGD